MELMQARDTPTWAASSACDHSFSARSTRSRVFILHTYDSNGNTATSVIGSNTTTYAWDFENRLAGVTLPGSGGTVSFKYDPFGRRIYKSSSSATSIYAYDGDNLIEETNATGGVVARYEQTQNVDEPLAMLRSAATSYYHADGLGSITSLSNGAGTLAQTYTFDSFGKATATSGSLTNPFQFTGREFDSETGLYFLRNRYYDSQSGRFLNEDPLGFEGDDVNFYAYVQNSPVSLVDPFGLQHQPGGPWHPEPGVKFACKWGTPALLCPRRSVFSRALSQAMWRGTSLTISLVDTQMTSLRS